MTPSVIFRYLYFVHFHKQECTKSKEIFFFLNNKTTSNIRHKGFAQFVHHIFLMFHERMGVTIEGDGGVFMS